MATPQHTVIFDTSAGDPHHGSGWLKNFRIVPIETGVERRTSLDITKEATATLQSNTHAEEERNKEIASAGRALFLAAFTIIIGSFLAVVAADLFQLKF